MTYLLSIDQGTTSSRAIIFDLNGASVFTAQEEFAQHYPDDGWVEHDADEIWDTTLNVSRKSLNWVRENGGTVAAIGITNQRETTVVWDKLTGKPIYPAIVWQDRRTAQLCSDLRNQGYEALVRDRTGLLLDPYFSATKIAWILDQVDGARQRALNGELLFGTIDSFLIYRLTGGQSHVTDATNASRTLIFNIHTQQWDDELLELFNIPRMVLPEVRNSADDFGVCKADILGQEIAISGVAGDQQAALIGQACVEKGMIKSTYGTGCFVVMNTGDTPVESQHRLLTTVAYRLNGKTTYALEGSIFIAGAAIQWLRDGLGILESAGQSEDLAKQLPDNQGVYLVPAFTGLGAPHWDPNARGAIFGLTRDTGPAHFVRAAIESVCYQTRDLLDAMSADGLPPRVLRVDGGMVNNSWLCQFLADILNIEVSRPVQTETTALGAALLAGMQEGIVDVGNLNAFWKSESTYQSEIEDETRVNLMKSWQGCVQRVLSE